MRLNIPIPPFFLYLLFTLLISCSDIPKTTLEQAKNGVIVSALSNDGRYGAVVSVNHDAAVWDLLDKKYLFSLKHKDNQQANIIALTFSQNGELLLTAEKTNIILWQIKTGRALVNYNLASQIQAIALSSDGQRALIGLINAKALLIDLNTGHLITTLSHTETINSVALSLNGKYALTGSDDHFAVLWDLKQVKVIHKIQHKKRVMFVAFSPDSNTLVTSTALAKPRLWERKSGHLKYALGNHPYSLSCLRFSNDSKRIALGIVPGQVDVWLLNEFQPTLKKRVYLAKPSFWRPSATIINGVAFDAQTNKLITQDSRGLAAWWLL